jgi:hypothetical protein
MHPWRRYRDDSRDSDRDLVAYLTFSDENLYHNIYSTILDAHRLAYLSSTPP